LLQCVVETLSCIYAAGAAQMNSITALRHE
jgi:hypothetical protein